MAISKIYVASSWRNNRQRTVVAFLREAGYNVYDFKEPKAGEDGFRWSDVDPNWKEWTPQIYREKLYNNPIALAGYVRDMSAMIDSDGCVLVLPCGRSAHLEAGYFIGAGKPLLILIEEAIEPELMYRMAAIVTSLEEMVSMLQSGVIPVPRL